MNFKINNKKFILGIILGLLITFSFYFLAQWIGCSGTKPLCEAGKVCASMGCSSFNLNDFITSLKIGIFVFILTYIIYSLIEKK